MSDNSTINSRWKLDYNARAVIIPRPLPNYCDSVVFELPCGLDAEDDRHYEEVALHIVALHNAAWERAHK